MLIKSHMHHTCLCIMPGVCGGCLLCCLILSGLLLSLASVSFRSCEIRSTTSVCLLHGLVLLPCGISGKMTTPSKSLLSLLASCSLYCFATLPSTCYIMPPILPCQASNPPFLASHCLAMLPLCSAPLIALLVAGEDGVCSMLEHRYLLGYHNIFYLY